MDKKKLITLLLFAAAGLFVLSSCGKKEDAHKGHDHPAAEHPASEHPQAAEAEEAKLCGKCGEVKGSEKCCAEGIEKCGKCGMHKGSPGCCPKPEENKSSSVPAEGTELTNKTCPVMGNPAKKEYSVEYKGKKIYFCCPGCDKMFLKNPDKYMSKLK
jgi:YHS domain-containing protein